MLFWMACKSNISFFLLYHLFIHLEMKAILAYEYKFSFGLQLESETFKSNNSRDWYFLNFNCYIKNLLIVKIPYRQCWEVNVEDDLKHSLMNSNYNENGFMVLGNAFSWQRNHYWNPCTSNQIGTRYIQFRTRVWFFFS